MNELLAIILTWIVLVIISTWMFYKVVGYAESVKVEYSSDDDLMVKSNELREMSEKFAERLWNTPIEPEPIMMAIPPRVYIPSDTPYYEQTVDTVFGEELNGCSKPTATYSDSYVLSHIAEKERDWEDVENNLWNNRTELAKLRYKVEKESRHIKTGRHKCPYCGQITSADECSKCGAPQDL